MLFLLEALRAQVGARDGSAAVELEGKQHTEQHTAQHTAQHKGAIQRPELPPRALVTPAIAADFRADEATAEGGGGSGTPAGAKATAVGAVHEGPGDEDRVSKAESWQAVCRFGVPRSAFLIRWKQQAGTSTHIPRRMLEEALRELSRPQAAEQGSTSPLTQLPPPAAPKEDSDAPAAKEDNGAPFTPTSPLTRPPAAASKEEDDAADDAAAAKADDAAPAAKEDDNAPATTMSPLAQLLVAAEEQDGSAPIIRRSRTIKEWRHEHHGTLGFVCPDCFRQFDDPDALLAHCNARVCTTRPSEGAADSKADAASAKVIVGVTAAEQKGFLCPDCFQRFDTPEALLAHGIANKCASKKKRAVAVDGYAQSERADRSVDEAGSPENKQTNSVEGTKPTPRHKPQAPIWLSGFVCPQCFMRLDGSDAWSSHVCPTLDENGYVGSPLAARGLRARIGDVGPDNELVPSVTVRPMAANGGGVEGALLEHEDENEEDLERDDEDEEDDCELRRDRSGHWTEYLVSDRYVGRGLGVACRQIAVDRSAHGCDVLRGMTVVGLSICLASSPRA